jgi:ribonuclease P protein component
VRHATHVRKRAEFERIQRSGERVHTERFVLIVARQADAGAPARLGITASRKIGGAVVRNRAKRLVRAAFRALPALLAPGFDLVVIVRKPLGELGLSDVIAEWNAASGKLRERVRGLLARATEAGKTRPVRP